MWRQMGKHERRETEFLDAALHRVRGKRDLLVRANATLQRAAAAEPLLAQALQAPQSPPHHAEGPLVEDHLRLMLMSLYAVLDEQLHLVDIEEFRRLKGYEGEVEELEETLKENAALFEVFVLCHDAAKWASVSFTSLPGSRGESLGFTTPAFVAWEDIGISERTKARTRYLALFERFAQEHPALQGAALEAAYYAYYGIQVHYAGHDRLIHAPAYRDLLHRMCAVHRLADRDRDLLEDLIAWHLQPIEDFHEARPARFARYVGAASRRGYDADDFIDLLQGCLFLDGVCGSERLDGRGRGHEATLLLNFLRAEHDYAPTRRAEKEQRREQQKKKEQQRVFHEVGLDGVALMELFRMEPGPEFGRLLREVHGAIVGEGKMPSFPAHIAEELRRRMDRYYASVFSRGV